jgi:hypothetical protein
MPIYAEAFKVFDAKACGMLHFSVWLRLSTNGMGQMAQISTTSPRSPRPSKRVLGKCLVSRKFVITPALLNFAVPTGAPT